MKIKIDFEQKFPIDRHDLATEWEYQHELFLYHAEKLEAAEEHLRQVTDNLDLKYAELDEDIRASTETKITEAAIKNKILLNPQYQEALTKVRRVQHEVGNCKIDVKALEMRKAGLENLVKLHGQEYYSNPSVSGIDGDKFLEQRTTQKISEQLNKPKPTTKMKRS